MQFVSYKGNLVAMIRLSNLFARMAKAAKKSSPDNLQIIETMKKTSTATATKAPKKANASTKTAASKTPASRSEAPKKRAVARGVSEEENFLGVRIRTMRAQRGWTLEMAGAACALARSTLSKIENGQMSPTYDALIKIAAGFEIDISELFASKQEPMGIARRSIQRAGSGDLHETPSYRHLLLCNDISNKSMVPFLSTITAREFEDFDGWSRHPGEEFVYVLSGAVRLFTEFYSPVDIAAGDCWYIDSRMGHRVISISEEDAQVLWMSMTPKRHNVS